MELRQIEAAVAVAQHGTFTAAADALHLAQPALWKRVRDLEAELGLVLYERVGRGVRITPEGEQFLALAQPVTAAADRLRALSRDIAAGVVGQITIGCLPAHVARFLAGAVQHFERDHPQMRARLRELDGPPSHHGRSGITVGSRVEPAPSSGATMAVGASERLRESLVAGEVDVITSGPLEGPFDGFPIYDVHIVALEPHRYGLGGTRALPVKRLQGKPLLVTPRGYLSRTVVDRACAAEGFEPTIAAESPNASTLVALGRHGAGIAVLADDAIPPLAGVGTRRLTSDAVALASQVWLYRRRTAITPALAGFLATAASLAADPARLSVSGEAHL